MCNSILINLYIKENIIEKLVNKIYNGIKPLHLRVEFERTV